MSIGTGRMASRIAEMSPRSRARIAGAFEAVEGLTSSFGQVIVLDRLVVSGNAAVTAANILGHERLFWWGFVSSLVGVVCHIAWTLLFYDLFKPVNKSLSLLAAFVMLVGCAFQALTAFFYLAPLLVLQGGSSLTAFTAPQLQALALIFLKLNALAFDIDLVFFGFWCILTGYLICRSTCLPRILGVLLAIDGLGWVTHLVPPFGRSLFPVIAVAAALAEFPLQLWLLIMGVNTQRWLEQATAARS